MPENEPLTYGERLEIVYRGVAESAPTNWALGQIATVGDAVLRFSTSDFGDLTVSMSISRDDNTRKLHVFASRVEGRWVPITENSGAEEFAQLVELAEAADWASEAE